MCLILFSLGHHRGYPLVIAANRDEAYARPSEPLGFWPDAPHIAAGRDLLAGGTWLGITRNGRWAALTNYRQPGSYRVQAPSRGGLVAAYLRGNDPAPRYLGKLEATAQQYNGFNLLAGDLAGSHYLSNREGRTRAVEPGVHGLSNHLLNTPWPKVALGRKYLLDLPLESPGAMIAALMSRLRDALAAADADLPDTGVGRDRERMLSPPFIVSDRYGTRASTVILVDSEGTVHVEERRFGPYGVALGSTAMQFSLDADALSTATERARRVG